ncbi:hypothetical protein, partial [Aneurinibacillus aneurinilyticus]|uniref:hypothetical protein n=1 Tax=Aneurinibacillus aneurinilyticus TaxID=1391 RepID=UPI003525B328
APARRKRTATVSLFASTRMFCGPAWLRQKVALDASVWETNRRPFGARCGDDPLWSILDNQHPCCIIPVYFITLCVFAYKKYIVL